MDAPPPARLGELLTANAPPTSPRDVTARLLGCLEKARLAGPFGHLSTTDLRVHFEAERAGPWPAVFPRDPLRLEAPRVRPAERVGCALRSPGAAPGIYYIESFIDLPADREVDRSRCRARTPSSSTTWRC